MYDLSFLEYLPNFLKKVLEETWLLFQVTFTNNDLIFVLLEEQETCYMSNKRQDYTHPTPRIAFSVGLG